MTSNDKHTPVDDPTELSDSSDSSESEDQTLAWLKRRDLESAALEKLAKSPSSKNRKIALALIEHPRTPRYAAVPLLRNLFTFDLMIVSLMAAVTSDLKIAAEATLINRMEKLSVGEKLSLARRASGGVVAALLSESDVRVVSMALENSRLTEAMVVKALATANSSDLLAQSVGRHRKWSLRSEVQNALQRRADRPRNDNTSGQTVSE